MNVFNKLYILIGKLFGKKQEIDSYNKLFSEIEIGDIIWGKRYFREEDEKNIPVGHREGPYIVLYKYDNKLVCSYGTGTYRERFSCVCFDNNDYKLYKETYFYLDDLNVLDDFSIIKKIDKLSERDRSSLLKKIKIEEKNYFNYDGNLRKFSLPLQSGDIVCSNNKNFIIIDVLDNKLLVIPFGNECIPNVFKLDMFEGLDYSKVSYLDVNDEIEFLKVIDNNVFLYILKKYKEYVYILNNKNITQRGSIILKNNRCYYIYGEEGQYWLAFEIIKDMGSNLEKINVKDNIVYTDFSDVRIDKKDNFNTIDLCMAREIKDIKNIRKNYKKSQLEVTNISSDIKNNELDKIEIGDNVSAEKYNNLEFLVLDIVGNIVVCINRTELSTSHPHKVYFDKSELQVIKKAKKKVKNR